MKASHFKNWYAFQKSFFLAEEIFRVSTCFPKEERYSLTDQIRRSSRSVCANLAESYGKRRYARHFVAKLTDCEAENFETQTWLDFALKSQYISEKDWKRLVDASEEVGKLLSYMQTNPDKFTGSRP